MTTKAMPNSRNKSRSFYPEPDWEEDGIEDTVSQKRFGGPRLHVALWKVEGEANYSIVALNLPGVASMGRTEEAAIENIKEAATLAIECYRDDGVGVPWGDVNLEGVCQNAKQRRIILDV